MQSDKEEAFTGCVVSVLFLDNMLVMRSSSVVKWHLFIHKYLRKDAAFIKEHAFGVILLLQACH